MAQQYQAYYKTNVQTSDQLTLILMLYDGALRFLKKAEKKIEENDVESAHNYLMRSKEIVSELMSTLRVDAGGEVGQNLKNLYMYVFNRIVEGNLTKDPEIIREVIRLLENLKQGWNYIKEQQTQQKADTALNSPPKKLKVQG